MSTPSQTLSLEHHLDHNTLTILLKGELTLATLQSAWTNCFNLIQNHPPKVVHLNCQDLSYIDSAGACVLLRIENTLKDQDIELRWLNMSDDIQKLINIFNSQTQVAIEPKRQSSSLIEHIGQTTVGACKGLMTNISFIGELTYKTGRSITHINKQTIRSTLGILYEGGPKALGIVALVGILFGLILSFQGVIALRIFGAQIYVVNMVAIALSRELAPLMAAVIVIGRSASAFAAELGSMKVNQEIDALKVMAIDTHQFLIIPRVLAILIAMPFLYLYMLFFGLLSCDWVMNMLGFSPTLYLNQLQSSLTSWDIAGGIIKSLVFGLLIAGIGCLWGLKTEQGASAVGRSATRAVVSCIIMVSIADGLFSIAFYMLGI